MRTCFKLLLMAFVVWMVSACANTHLQTAAPSPVPRGPEVHGVFAGNTPCDPQARSLFQIPPGHDCEQMIWSIILYQDPQTKTPGTYSLRTSYGLSKQGTNNLVGGGTPISVEGTWAITTGTKNDPDAVVYQLHSGDSEKTLSFLSISDDLIHVLSGEKAMLVGNGAWSYTLSRVEHQNQTQAQELSGSLPDPPTRPPQPPMPADSSVAGVFDGRTPCNEVVLVFTETASPGCIKVKWRLTLYQDSTSGEPNRYLFMGTRGYQEGSWKIIHGMDDEPDAILYQLQPDDSQESFHFLKVDDNHLFLMDRDLNLLVGNELFSYTLSRTEP